ncbi:MAG: hypothetical protein QXL78_01130 [Methanocellales archaeon]
MTINECGDEVPDKIIQKAKEVGCMNCPKYVYINGKYGGRPPVASIGGEKVTRFRNIANAEKMKFDLGDGWVAFKSPSASRGIRNRSVGKGKGEPCAICGEDRFQVNGHFPTPKRKGGTKTIPLCPTHHELLDDGRLSPCELDEIRRKIYPEFGSLDEFIIWAKDNGYPYDIEDMKKKKLWENYEEKEVCYRICYRVKH